MSNVPNSNEEFHYTYITTDNRNGKYYVGRHSTNNLNDGYQGSGKFIKDCINSLKTQNNNLTTSVSNLKDEVVTLKKEVETFRKMVTEDIRKIVDKLV